METLKWRYGHYIYLSHSCRQILVTDMPDKQATKRVNSTLINHEMILSAISIFYHYTVKNNAYTFWEERHETIANWFVSIKVPSVLQNAPFGQYLETDQTFLT